MELSDLVIVTKAGSCLRLLLVSLDLRTLSRAWSWEGFGADDLLTYHCSLWPILGTLGAGS